MKPVSLATDEERLRNLEALAEELMKNKPKPEVVKDFMAKTGLDYKEDPIENINSVLTALQFQHSDLNFERK